MLKRAFLEMKKSVLEGLLLKRCFCNIGSEAVISIAYPMKRYILGFASNMTKIKEFSEVSKRDNTSAE